MEFSILNWSWLGGRSNKDKTRRNMELSKEELILLVLRAGSIRERFLGAALFLIWRILGSQEKWPFNFRPLGQSPWTTSCQSSLSALSRQHFITRSPSQSQGVELFCLTEAGRYEADRLAPVIDQPILDSIEAIALEMVNLSQSQFIFKFSEAPASLSTPPEPANIRKKARKKLPSDAQTSEKIREVSGWLGYHEEVFLSAYEMAGMLGSNEDHAKYSLTGSWQAVRPCKASVEVVSGKRFKSAGLGFTIWLPEGWEVVHEDTETEDLRQTLQAEIDQWVLYSGKEKVERVRAFLVTLPEKHCVLGTAYRGYLVGEEFLIDLNYLDWLLKEMLRLKEQQGRRLGFWIAKPAPESNPDSPSVEVVKFGLNTPMTARELYFAEKPSDDSIIRGGRLVTWKENIVDHMPIVKACYDLRSPNENAGGRDTSLFATYSTDGLTGWAIKCWCNPAEKHQLRLLFQRMVSSFSRTG